MTYSAKLTHRLAAWLMTLIMLVTGFVWPAYAQQQEWELLNITVSWTDKNGDIREAVAMPVTWGGEQAFWVKVGSRAIKNGMTLHISHPEHADYVYDPADGALLTEVVDSGSAMDIMNSIPINAYLGEEWMGLYSLYVSTEIDMPEEPVKEPAKAKVKIVYRAEDGTVLDEETVRMTEGGDNMVYARQFDGYTLVSSESVWVDVSAEGATPNPVEFIYAQSLAKKKVTIICRTEDGTVLNEETRRLTEGQDNTIYAPSFDGYTLVGEDQIWVNVTSEGANPNPVEFIYRKNATKVKVSVVHRTEDGVVLHEETVRMSEGGDNTVYAQQFDGYTLISDESIQVQVSGGEASPNPAEFIYRKNAAKVKVRVVYMTKSGDILDEGSIRMTQGEDNTVSAREFDGYTLVSDQTVRVEVTDEGAFPNPVEFIYDRNLNSADVRIVYMTENGDVLDEETVRMNEGGDNTVRARQFDGYTLTSDESVWVDVTSFGASPNPVEFIYRRDAATVKVRIVYMTEDGDMLDEESVRLTEGGDNTVRARRFDGYTLVSDERVWVDVTASGASPNPVEFIYRRARAAQTDVLVRYLDGRGRALADQHYVTCYEGQDNAIRALDIRGYHLQGDDVVYVVVNSDGSASHSEVTFYYEKDEEPTQAPTEEPTREPEASDAVVTVYYVDETTGQTFFTDYVTVPAGRTTTIAPSAPLVEDYEAVSAAPVKVKVDRYGNPDRNEITFTFRLPQQQATVEIYFQNERGHEVATAQTMLLGNGLHIIVAKPADLMDGYVLNGTGEVEVTVRGGVADRDVIVFHYTLEQDDPTPVPTNTPEPEAPIPDGEMINRFGVITKPKTALRVGPGKENNLVTRLEKDSLVYMLRMERNAKGERWARVLINGETYFVSGDCIEYLPQYQSDDWMDTLATPVPPFTQEDLDGRPTAEPTQAPTPEPEAYTGYALVTGDLALRTSAAGGNGTIIYVASQGEVLLVRDQTFMSGGDVWSYVETLEGVGGYVPDEALRHISDEEAAYYIDQWNEANATPTPTVIPEPTEEPEQYAGYALTIEAVALRTRISSSDSTIIRRMDTNELVTVHAQRYSDGTAWSRVTDMEGTSGYVPNSSLRYISDAEAQTYIDMWHENNPTPPPATPEPQKISGYAITIGDDVYFRHQASAMSSIIDVLPRDVVVYVRDQYYQNGEAWHVVQYNKQWGYIRADMLRMLTAEEENEYLNNIASPEPTSAITPEPYNPDSLSSYGYVSDSSVNFRTEPNTSSSRIRTLRKYAFCLVLDTTEVDGVTWYHINYGGQVGYVHGRYFHQMSISELEEFLDSEEYLQGLTNNSNGGSGNNQDHTGGNGGNGFVSAEDDTVDNWTNPNNGLQVSYAPFDPFATPAPVATATVTPTAQPTATLAPMPTMDVTYPTGNEGQGGIWGWVIAVILIALLGGGVYVYLAYRENQRKAAQRAAARRAQAAAQQRSQESRPYARTSGQPVQPRTGTYPNQSAQRSAVPQVRRPYPSQGSYSRPAEEDQPRQADYSATYRNPNPTENVRPVGRRSAYRARQQQQNEWQENEDFRSDAGDEE